MKKQKKNLTKSRKSLYLYISTFALVLGVITGFLYLKLNLLEGKIANFLPQALQVLPQETAPATTTYKVLIVGDIFLDRHIDELTQIDNAKILKEKINRNLYSYPFQGLDTLERNKYDAWVGNLECPVTDEQSTKRQKSVELRFSCKKEYLSELKKYFDIVSLANNHTDNMNKESGLIETRKHLDSAGIKYFGHYDSSKQDELCKVIEVKNLPIAFCGFHGVYKLPTEKELEIIKKYSDKYITIVMPHQGTEYEFTAGTYQKKLYRKMIDHGADVVIGAHPHVIQNVETYKGKRIFYSLGNFIFDQSWAKTREHMVIDMEIVIDNLAKNGTSTKPIFTISYKPIFTSARTDFITRKQNLTEAQYQQKLKSIGF